MKNKILVPLVAALLSLATGCSANSTSSQSGSKETETTQVSSQMAMSQSEKSTEETTETTTESSVSEQDQSENAETAAVLHALKATFSNDALSTDILTEEAADYLTAATTPTADQTNFSILYYAEPTAIPINDQRVNELTPLAAFEKQTYATNEEARAAVGKVADYQGKPVDLGYGITGYQQGAAGSSFLTWAEGNWALLVRASNQEGENPKPLAVQVVNYLEQAMLPAPQSDGMIQLDVRPGTDYRANSVIWQKGKVVYKVYHAESMQALAMAVSMNQ